MQLRKESPKKSGLPGNNFIFIFPGYITNQFNDQLPVGLIAQLVRALHRYRRGQGSNPGKPDFFGLSFRNCISCLRGSSLRLFLHSAVQIYEFHIFIISMYYVLPYYWSWCFFFLFPSKTHCHPLHSLRYDDKVIPWKVHECYAS